MRVDVAVGRVRSAVDFEDQRVLLPGIEVRRFENPALNVSAVEALVPDLLRFALLDAAEQLLVHVGDLSRLSLDHEQIADVGLS